MSKTIHDAVQHNATALVISFLTIILMLWQSIILLKQPDLRLLGIITIIVIFLALGVSLIVLLARRLKH